MSTFQDSLLLEAYGVFGKQWKRVANHVGDNRDRSQCQHRYSVYVGPQEEARRAVERGLIGHAPHAAPQAWKIKMGPWLDEEVSSTQLSVTNVATLMYCRSSICDIWWRSIAPSPRVVRQ